VALVSSRPTAPAVAGNPLRLALGLWLALGAVTGARTLISPDRHTVFPIFAAGATHWWADRPLYATYPPLDLFRYPPPFAVAFTPFAALGPRAGGVLWTWAGLAAYAAGLWRFAGDVLPRGWTPARAAAFSALGASVALPGLWNGQSNALAVGLLLLAVSALVRRRWWTAALLLAAAAWTKLTPLAPALLLCALWPRQLAPRLTAALVLGSLVPFVTRPPDVVLRHYAEWVAQLWHSGGTRWPGFRDAWTAWLVARHLLRGGGGAVPFLQPVAPAYVGVQLLSAACALAWCLWQQARRHRPRWLVRVTLAMGMAWLMLFGPAVEHATYAFLAPPLAWALLERGSGPRGRWLIVTAFVLIAVLGWDPLTRPWLDQLPFLLAALPVGSALLTVWLIGYTPGPEPRTR
jgi:hypothetical protein